MRAGGVRGRRGGKTVAAGCGGGPAAVEEVVANSFGYHVIGSARDSNLND